jgi:hypothetical protein
LQAQGYRVGHEVVGPDGVVSWVHVGVGSVPWLQSPITGKLKFDEVIHLVRYPLDVIASAAFTEHESALAYMKANIPTLPDYDASSSESRLRFYLHAWPAWNELIVEKFAPRERRWVEDFQNKGDNSRLHHKLTWSALTDLDARATERVLDLGTAYGYELE